ncbi:Protein of unknown function [Gryllus bimaculatus]|nr:Protein of unknown function [Gryllus bimaculatus]
MAGWEVEVAHRMAVGDDKDRLPGRCIQLRLVGPKTHDIQLAHQMRDLALKMNQADKKRVFRKRVHLPPPRLPGRLSGRLCPLGKECAGSRGQAHGASGTRGEGTILLTKDKRTDQPNPAAESHTTLAPASCIEIHRRISHQCTRNQAGIVPENARSTNYYEAKS